MNYYKLPPRKKKLHWMELVLALVFLAVLIISFSACNSVSKSVSYLKNHDTLAGVCHELFPVRDSIVTRDSIQYDTLYIPEPAYASDTVYLEGNPIPVFTNCPPTMVITKTQLRDSIIFRKDSAGEAAKDEQIRKLQKQNGDLIVVNKDLTVKNQQNSSYKWKAWITWILLVLGVIVGIILKIKKVF